MKVLKESLCLEEDIYSDFEPGTYFKQIKDKNGRPYAKPTVYKVMRQVSPGHLLCDVVGHWASNKFEVSAAYLQKATELGFFQIVDYEERERLIAEEEKRKAQRRELERKSK